MKSIIIMGTFVLAAVFISTDARAAPGPRPNPPGPRGVYFDCLHRVGQKDLCEPHGQCGADGHECDCSVGFRLVNSIHCVNESYIRCTDSQDCSGNGECFEDETKKKTCYCDMEHIGVTCQTHRQTATCTTDYMSVEVTPLGNADRVFTVNDQTVPATQCDLSKDLSKTTWTRIFNLTSPLPCGVMQRRRRFGVRVRVHYNVDPLARDTDLMLPAICPES